MVRKNRNNFTIPGTSMKSQKKSHRKAKSDRLTMIIIPESTASPKRLNMSQRTLRIAAVLTGIFIVGALLITALYSSSQADIRRVQAIKAESRMKDETIELLDEQLRQIEEQQERLNRKQTDIKKMMGIKGETPAETETSSGGKGGSGPEKAASVSGDTLMRAQQMKNRMDAQEKELDELLARVNNDREYFRTIPNQWPTQGEISSSYGWRDSPFGGRRESFHDGLDIANNVGTEIVAAADGAVTFAGWKAVYGRTIIVDHGNGFSTKYSHNSALLVEEGEQVHKGQVIAKMGSSGRSTGPHLHFTIYKGDQTLDPLIYLPRLEDNN